ncbi:MAG: hypothetical protein HY752_08575 [Nitrospirae bacterium]|nr:hypothetical protein [Nitrospirota bacterium]
MDIDVSIGKESLTINIENPYRFDKNGVMKNIVDFGTRFGLDLKAFQIDQLIQRMIKGVAGCEDGCPADALAVIRAGFGCFKLSYIDGGILSAKCTLDSGTPLEVKIFPEF